MLVIFDLDGTLISSYMDEPDQDYGRWHVLPGRRERLAELLTTGHTVGIVTNQGGVGLGYTPEEQAHAKIAQALDTLGLPPDTTIAVCFGHVESQDPRYNHPEVVARRKPSGIMIREVIAAQPTAAAAGVIYVGDRPEDQAAANDAGVPFIHAAQYFGDH
jgi:D-glycero-D-manno-heptose 1,7-bisphosphate phosphatase